MRSHPVLSRLIRHITLASLAVAAAPACGGATGGAEPSADGGAGPALDAGTPADATADTGPRPGFDATVCDGDVYDLLSGLTPAVPVDFLEVRSQLLGAPDGGYEPATAGKSTGTPCAAAKDKDKCTSAYQVASMGTGVGWKPVVWDAGLVRESIYFLVYTRGDEVGTVTSIPDVVTFLAPIEGPKDAAFLATQDGYFFVCPSINARVTSGAVELVARSGFACGEGTHLDENLLSVSAKGEISVLETKVIQQGTGGCAVGRRPEGLVRDGACAGQRPLSPGELFAEIAELEAASIPAFAQLARELEAHGAPAALVDAARAAREDEVRHARSTGRLARKFGEAPRAPRVEPKAAVRSLFEVALDNAVEGCVRETFGAIFASLQAERAEDAGVRRAMAVIAADETRHAALSWDVDAWARERLSPDEREAITIAQARALRELGASLARPQLAATERVAGVPGPALAKRAFDAFTKALFAA